MKLSDNIWDTRKAKIQAETRLLLYDFHSQLLLIWYAAAATCASVYQISFQPQSQYAQVAMVSYSVLTLCASLFIANRQFKQRAMLVKECYEGLKPLCAEADAAEIAGNETRLTELNVEYDKFLGLCENHKEIDYIWSCIKRHLTTHKNNQKPDSAPTRYMWIKAICNYIAGKSCLAFLYATPILIFYGVQ